MLIPSQVIPDEESAALSMRYSITKNQLYPSGANDCSLPQLRQKREQWRAEGSLVLFSTGVFDIFHLNHLLALTKYRLLGAKEYAAEHQPEALASPYLLRTLAASNSIRLILSIDSDAHVARNKAFRLEKGNCVRPLLSWESRALMVANQCISDSTTSRVLVDAITSHGLGTDNCPNDMCLQHESDQVASIVQPDTIILSKDNHTTHQKVLRNANLRTAKIITTQEASAHKDPLLGGQITSTAIVVRALSRA